MDTSALVAIVRREPSADWLVERLETADQRTMAAATALEAGIVLEGRSRDVPGIARRAIRDLEIAVLPFDDELSERAMEGWRRFGKGRHPAGLNFGDCCTYALAITSGAPILCVGSDFPRTDAAVVGPPEA